jgi:hypothetical protein
MAFMIEPGYSERPKAKKGDARTASVPSGRIRRLLVSSGPAVWRGARPLRSRALQILQRF